MHASRYLDIVKSLVLEVVIFIFGKRKDGVLSAYIQYSVSWF
jgi:hypothetical protein